MCRNTIDIVVTGASGGIGAAIVSALGAYNVVPHYREYGDLTDEEHVKDFFNSLDPFALICCAGNNIPTDNDNALLDPHIFDKILKRNLMSAVLCCQAVVPKMMLQGAGRIITIGSYAGCFGRLNGVAYSVAKAALHEYTRCLATHLRPYNVCVNCVSPGNTHTPRFIKDHDKLPSGIGLDRAATPEEIAEVVAFLCEDSSRFVSGQIIRVDGGRHSFPC